MSELGIDYGEICWRNGCQGEIDMHPKGDCSCHLNPPCGACTEHREFCPLCGWEARDEEKPFNEFVVKYDKNGVWESWKPRPLDPRKIDYHIKVHTNSSQICEGVYPEGTQQSEVLALVKGTFGGRFEYFKDGKFKYIAYTD